MDRLPGTLLILGAISLALSFLSLALPPRALTSMALFSLLSAGAILLGEGATLHFRGESFLKERLSTWQGMIALLAATTIAGLLFDGIAKGLGGLWSYPYWDASFYAFVFVPGFFVYWVSIVESLRGIEAVLLVKRRSSAALPRTVAILGSVGIAASGLVVAHQLLGGERAGFFSLTLFYLCLWLVLEYAASRRGVPLVLASLREGRYRKLASAIIAALLFGTLTEVQNAPMGLWVYANFPLMEATLLGSPLVPILMWPVQYLLFPALLAAASSLAKIGR